MKSFRIYWLTGQTEIVKGEYFAEALRNAGYGKGSLLAMDFHQEGDSIDYTYSKGAKEWKKNVV